MRVLLFGSQGMLARDLVQTAPPGVVLDALDRQHADVTDHAAVKAAIDFYAPEIVINATAYTAVDRAESEREAAEAVNAAAVASIAEMSRRAGALLVHFSTDYVFPGTGTLPYAETDPTRPVNAYGSTKLHGEQAIAAHGGDSLVIRTQWLFGAHGRSFPMTMRDRALRGEETRVVNDQRGRPTYTVDLARATWRLVDRGARGIFHVANAGEATWFELAAHIFRQVGSTAKLTPCATADYPTPAARPRYSVLDTTLADRTLGGSLPQWTNAVDRFLVEVGPPVAA